MFLLRRLAGRSHDLNTTGGSNIPSHREDEVLREAFQQANEDVVEGNYERALWLLEKLGQSDPPIKGVAELVAVAEVCSAATLSSCMCMYKGNRKPDWYKILKVDEKSDVGDIKRTYRHFALLLHPDKNKHAKAEAAFKLVSEAYACLSDKKKRANFNAGRSQRRCRSCNPTDRSTSEFDRWSTCGVLQGRKKDLRRPESSPDLTQQGDWILDQERLKLFRGRARARVIGNLAKAWEEREFTRIGELCLSRKKYSSSKVDTARTTLNEERRGRKVNGSETVGMEGSNEGADFCPLVTDSDKSKKKEYGMVVMASDNTSHQQIARPCTTLDSLIQDLRAELISGVESRGYHQTEDVTVQGLRETKLLETKANCSDIQMVDSLSQDYAVGCNTSVMKMPAGIGVLKTFPLCQARNEGLNEASSPAGPSSSLRNYSCPLVSLENCPNTMREDTSVSYESISEVCCKEEQLMCKSTCTSCLEPRKLETIHGIGLTQTYTENKCFGATKHDGESVSCTSIPWRLRRDDSLDMEETILQKQKEKSELLLRTLQRLREETQTVAASLDHLSRY